MAVMLLTHYDLIDYLRWSFSLIIVFDIEIESARVACIAYKWKENMDWQ